MGSEDFICKLVEQGFSQGSCLTFYKLEHFYAGSYIRDRACKVTLKWERGMPYRVIKSIQLSHPEDYLSVYQSGCNFSCLKCHSWEFTQYKNSRWMSTEDIFKVAKEYVKYVTVVETRYRATSFHAQDLCKHCGECVVTGRRSSFCPGVLSKEQILLSPQGYGPARNIVAFTGGSCLQSRMVWYDCRKDKDRKLRSMDTF